MSPPETPSEDRPHGLPRWVQRLTRRRAQADAPDVSAARTILLVRLGKLGDLIVSTFVFAALRQAAPNARLVLLTLPRAAQLFPPDHPDLDAVLTFDRRHLPGLARELRRLRPDLLLDLNDTPSTTSALISLVAGAKTAVGFDFDETRHAFHRTVPVADKTRTHVVDRLADLLRSVGVAVDQPHPRLVINPTAERDVAVHLRQRIGPADLLVGLNLSAGHESRYWPVEKWGELSRSLLGLDSRIRLLVLADPADSSKVKQLIAHMDPAVVVLPAHRTFAHFAAYIGHVSLIVTPDTSAVHVASALGIPVVALYPPPDWNFASWAPFAVPHRSLRPDRADGSVADIVPARVFAAARDLLGSLGLLD